MMHCPLTASCIVMMEGTVQTVDNGQSTPLHMQPAAMVRHQVCAQTMVYNGSNCASKGMFLFKVSLETVYKLVEKMCSQKHTK